MTNLVPISDGLCRHDAGVHDARPDRERDQAAVLGGIARSGDEVGTEDRINPANHLQVVLAMSTVPQPT